MKHSQNNEMELELRSINKDGKELNQTTPFHQASRPPHHRSCLNLQGKTES